MAFGRTPATRKQWWIDHLYLLNGEWHVVDLNEPGDVFPGTEANFRSWAYRAAEEVGHVVKIAKQRWHEAPISKFEVQATSRRPHSDEYPWAAHLQASIEAQAEKLRTGEAAQLQAEHDHETQLLADRCSCQSTPHLPNCAVWG